MIIGRWYCEKCGEDCTNLYGFALMTRGTIRNKNVQDELAKFKKQFGKEEMVWCWPCTAKAFGSLATPQKQETQTTDSAQTFTIEDNKR